MNTQRYTSHIVSKQPGYWRLELRPIAKPALPTVTRQRKAEPVPMSLQQFIKFRGGLNPDYNNGAWSGEIAMVRDSGKQGVVPGVFVRKAKLTFEEMAEECCDAGYFSEPDIDAMLWYLAKDIEATLTQERRYRVYGFDGYDYKYAQDLERWESLLPEVAA